MYFVSNENRRKTNVRAIHNTYGGGALPDFLFCSLFPVQQTTSERDWPLCKKVIFSGWQSIRRM